MLLVVLPKWLPSQETLTSSTIPLNLYIQHKGRWALLLTTLILKEPLSLVFDFFSFFKVFLFTMVHFSSLARGALLATVASAYISSRQESQSLHDAFTAAGKLYFGNIAEQALLENAQNEPILAADFGALTCENSMKWDATERE